MGRNGSENSPPPVGAAATCRLPDHRQQLRRERHSACEAMPRQADEALFSMRDDYGLIIFPYRKCVELAQRRVASTRLPPVRS